MLIHPPPQNVTVTVFLSLFLCGFFLFQFSLLFVAFGFYRPVVCGLLAMSEAFWNLSRCFLSHAEGRRLEVGKNARSVWKWKRKNALSEELELLLETHTDTGVV